MIFGLLSGYRFLLLRVLSFLWYRDGDKVRFKVSRNRLVMGQCLMQPQKDEAKFRYVLYNLGGGLANLLVALALVAAFIGGDGGDIVNGIFFGGIAANLVMAAMNLIPMGANVPNDGMNAWKASRSPEAKRGLYLMLHVNDELMEGKRYSDYDEDEFSLPENADLNNYLVASIVMHEAARLFDMGRPHESIDQYKRLDLGKLQAYYRNSVYAEMLYYCIVYQKDTELARDIYARAGVEKLLLTGSLSYLRILAAYEFFVNGDHAKGRRLLGTAIAAVAKHSNKGLGLMEGEYNAQLKNMMDEAE